MGAGMRPVPVGGGRRQTLSLKSNLVHSLRISLFFVLLGDEMTWLAGALSIIVHK